MNFDAVVLEAIYQSVCKRGYRHGRRVFLALSNKVVYDMYRKGEL